MSLAPLMEVGGRRAVEEQEAAIRAKQAAARHRVGQSRRAGVRVRHRMGGGG